MSKRDYYQVLGVSKSSTAAELKSAYRKKALEFHPDRNKSKDAEEKFKEVNEAYEILSDAQKKQTYDQFGHSAFDQASGGGVGGFGNRSGRTGPFTYTYTTNFGGQNNFGNFDFSDPFEVFESFFGGNFAANRAQAKPRYSLQIDFMEAAKGTQKSLVHQGKSYTINIPAGADDGTRIRYDNFDVTIDVHNHDVFKREGYDLYIRHKIPFVDAALGTTIEVPTLQKPVKLKVRPGTQPGTMIRLKGQGIKHIRGTAQGDQYVSLVITTPENLNKEQKALLKRLKDSSS